MRGASATSVCNPLPCPPLPPLPLSSLCGPLKLTKHHYLVPAPFLFFKEKSSWCQGHAHYQIPGASISGPWPGISLALTVACLS